MTGPTPGPEWIFYRVRATGEIVGYDAATKQRYELRSRPTPSDVQDPCHAVFRDASGRVCENFLIPLTAHRFKTTVFEPVPWARVPAPWRALFERDLF